MQKKLTMNFRDAITPTADKFILFNMAPVKPNKESQKLMRDFSIAEIALFIIKFKVDRQTSFHKSYQNLIK